MIYSSMNRKRFFKTDKNLNGNKDDITPIKKNPSLSSEHNKKTGGSSGLYSSSIIRKLTENSSINKKKDRSEVVTIKPASIKKSNLIKHKNNDLRETNTNKDKEISDKNLEDKNILEQEVIKLKEELTLIRNEYGRLVNQNEIDINMKNNEIRNLEEFILDIKENYRQLNSKYSSEK